jgi:hypothetical protein
MCVWGGVTKEVIHLLCPLHVPRGLPVAGSHSQMLPSMSPLATKAPSGDHATHSTQFLWPCRHKHSSISPYIVYKLLHFRY